ncbi:hypothetical protein FOMG_17797 [Fusarium oxysporum f. sp. melonis 26406]|uniref:Uncharacterized protein n=1 Tax=Fusarium oxysporum f. sp. melonis 26406 TaxID=1089452 RepID=W9Z2G1_FUSOX|nr:hypothetical protein FOMG_17797 [Fusarium oxysporum f. sp. melonis 26406]
MPGFLVPDTYVVVAPTLNDLLVASIIWGFTLATGVFAGAKAFKQTYASWRRSGRFHLYASLVWAEWTVSMVIGVLSWTFIRGFIEPSFWIYFVFLCLWVVQIQCICGIIISRIALLMVDKRKAVKIRWVTALLLGLINISVFIIWIPARLQISPTWIHVNEIYDRIEKGLFLIIDASLHFYFVYLLRVELIANGLDKYVPLFRFNLIMVFVSISLDIILICSMSIGNGFVSVLGSLSVLVLTSMLTIYCLRSYVQFHPLVYMIKLHIEMNISALIVKVVRATGINSSYNNDSAQGTELQSKFRGNTQAAGPSGYKTGLEASGQFFSSHNEAHIEAGASGKPATKGITRTVQTRVTVTSRQHEEEDEDGSSQSSTRQLKRSSHVYQSPFDEGMPTNEEAGISENEA